MTIGLDKPIIVISTGMLDLVDDEGLRFVIGHEVGHVLSGHAVYRTMLLQLINIATAIQWMPIGAWGVRAIIFGLNEWFRKSELSCDRAGLLCSQDPRAALRVHASLAGAENPDEMDVAAFLDQAEEYESTRRRPRQLDQDPADQRPDPSARRDARRRAAEVGRRTGIRRHPGRELSATLRGQGRADERGRRRPPPTPTRRTSPPPAIRWSSWSAGSARWPAPSAAARPIGCATGGGAAAATRQVGRLGSIRDRGMSVGAPRIGSGP